MKAQIGFEHILLVGSILLLVGVSVLFIGFAPDLFPDTCKDNDVKICSVNSELGNQICKNNEWQDCILDEESEISEPVDTFCGDGIVNGSEDCDAEDFSEETCETLGYDSGTLKCTEDCVYDFSECETEVVDDNLPSDDETDDDSSTNEPIDNSPKSFNEFIEASKNCESAITYYVVPSSEIFGIIIIVNSRLEIQGVQNNKCVYFQQAEEVTVEFSDGLKQQMIAGGQTDSEINEELQKANDNAQQLVGSEKICKFDTGDLTEMLQNWQDDKFLTEDWANAECEEHSPKFES